METKITYLSKDRKFELLDTPIIQVLGALGCKVEHTSGMMFYSPFRDERTPSMHVNIQKNQWYDHGNKKSGNVLHLIMEILHCDKDEAYRFLDRLQPLSKYDYRQDIINVSGHQSSYRSLGKFKIKNISDRITSPALLEYGCKVRCIPKSILNRYCSQVNYCWEHDGRESREYCSLGFPNKTGNWALRDSRPKEKGGQRSTGNDVTIIDRYGCFLTEKDNNIRPSSADCVVFEGFMDFLSWFPWSGRGITPEDKDVIVLNSVANREKAMEFLGKHKRVFVFLDNDEAGLTCSQNIADGLRGKSKVYNGSVKFSGYNDLNEHWQHICQNMEKKTEQLKL